MTISTIREPERVSVTVAQGLPGPIGPVGPEGPVGPPGPPGTVSAAGDGTAAAPGIAFASDTNTGFYRVAEGVVGFSSNGTQRWQISDRGVQTNSLRVEDTSPPTTGQGMELVYTPGTGGQIQALNRSPFAWQSLIFYGSTMSFGTGGTARWTVDSTGHLLAQTDNTYDIGASGANRPRSIYVGSSVVTPQIRMSKGTAAATNPGGNLGVLYFRDGTTAGTLKLVVRAGAAGAETTVLDNIPQ